MKIAAPATVAIASPRSRRGRPLRSQTIAAISQMVASR